MLKHAKASRVTIHIGHCDTGLVVEVTDDGVGIQAGAANGSGLTGMRDRIEAVGGGITVTRPDRGGTSILARLPVRARQARDA